MPTSVQDMAQLALDEQVVDDSALEDALEDRQLRKQAVSTARKDYAELHERVLAILSEHDLGDGAALRVGRFRISKRSVAPREVAFETKPTSRISIAVIE